MGGKSFENQIKNIKIPKEFIDFILSYQNITKNVNEIKEKNILSEKEYKSRYENVRRNGNVFR